MIERLRWRWLNIVLLVTAGEALAPGQELPGGRDRPAVADFADLSRWKAELPAGVALSAGPGHTARLEWKSKTADATHPAVAVLKLAQAASLPGDARRAGLWLYVQRPGELYGVWLMLRDADGRAFQYRLAKLSAWAKGWRYIDSFAFGTNESGKIHPEVGSVRDGRSPIPRPPLSLRGVRLESRQPMDGAWLLGQIETSAVTRGDGSWRWGLNLFGQHNWQTTSLLREGEPPYLLAGYLLPEGGDAQAVWRVRAGFQGPVIAAGTHRLQFDAQDVAAQGERISLGQLPPGKYEVAVNLAETSDMLANGGAERGRPFTRKQFTLYVLQSPVAPAPLPKRVWSAAPGESLAIPLPGWVRQGDRWEIRDAVGASAAAGETSARSVTWRPSHPGLFTFCLRRMDGGVIVDEETLLLGCRTPLGDIGTAEFSLRDQAATDADLFGPGKNYFTWATYEMNPSEPNFFRAFCNWVDDGRAAGFDLFRVRINWNEVEPLPGVFDFALVDRCVAAVVARGGRVVPEIVTSHTPAWIDNQLQRDAEGRADLWTHGSLGTTITSIWTPGLLDAVRRFVDASVRRYRNNPHVMAYHLWGLPGCCDWPFVDKPWWGQVTDYAPVAEAAFRQWSQGKYAVAPVPDPDWTHPDLRPQWRAWTQFKAYGAERFILDAVIAPLRALDDRRPVPGYYGFEFAAPRIAESARRQNWFRHTGGCDLYYQTTMFAAEALHATHHPWPQEVGGMTPTSAELELATWQASAYGGLGLNWNYYWREGIRVGGWTPERNEAVAEWQLKWAPLWRELRDAQLAQPPDLAVVKTWSTMHYGLRTYFPHRLNDYCSPFAAVVYRDHLWPTWFSENCDLDFLPRQKLVIAAPGAARVMPRELADALASYVRNGGRLVLFPDSGSWVVEEPSQPGALLRRLGWTGPAALTQAGTGEVGNSGLAASTPAVVEARIAARSAALKPLKVLPMTGCVTLTKGPGEVHAAFPDGSPAAMGWKCGRGEVLLLAGTPRWEEAAGLFQALYHWAGGRQAVGAGAPSVMVNHLVKGQTHYLLVHRGPDNLSPRLPTLDRTRLEAMPPLATEVFARDFPPCRWRTTDLTGNGQVRRQVTSAELAHGLPVSLHLAQTKVFRLEPEAAGGH